MEVKVMSGQSIFDISIETTGIPDNAFAIAKANGKSVSDSLEVGEVLTIPGGLTSDVNVLQYYKARNIIPATALGLNTINDYSFPGGEFPISL